jgi:peptide deformylase
MAILKIARMGHPVLRQPSEPVADPGASEIKHLIADMIDTMRDAQGIGLAAPQVHVAKRVVIFHVPAERTDEETEDDPSSGPRPLTILINPEIEPLGEERTLDWEACLSVPGMMGMVPRFAHIRYRGIAADGALVERVAEGFHARVVQHECDHLDGLLYPLRMTDLSQFGFVEELRHAADASGEL